MERSLENRMLSKKNFPYWTGFILVYCVVVAAIIWFYTTGRYGSHARKTGGREWALTYSDMRSLIIEIQVYAEYSETPPPGDISSLPDFFERIDPGLGKRSFFELFKSYEPNTGEFLDRWGNPIRLVVISPHHYRLVSRGKNGSDENGEGDDIVCDFDPLEYVRSKEPNEAQLKNDKHGCCSRRTDANLR